jgi:hypothetical protein
MCHGPARTKLEIDHTSAAAASPVSLLAPRSCEEPPSIEGYADVVIAIRKHEGLTLSSEVDVKYKSEPPTVAVQLRHV